MAKLADAHASGVCGGNPMRVQVSPAALAFSGFRKGECGTKFLRISIKHNRIFDNLVTAIDQHLRKVTT